MSHSVESEAVVKNRFLGFLIWQSISSTLIFSFFTIFFSANLPITLLSLLTFQLSQLLFSVSLSIVSSPNSVRPASPLQLISGLIRLVLVSSESATDDFHRRAKLSLSFILFIAAASVSGFVAVLSLCWGNDVDVGRLGLKGFTIGFLYGVVFIWKRRWILKFPIVQRAPFFSFKIGLPLAATRALKFSAASLVCSWLLSVLFENKIQVIRGKHFSESIIFISGCFVLFLCWELNHHLHQVLHTKRYKFAPAQGSAAAETNPSEPLLCALEESIDGTLLQYLAYLDLRLVCECNVDIWRRAAFFEETSETYRRVINVCLKPLEQLASKLGTLDNSCLLSSQLQLPSIPNLDSNHSEPLNNIQLYIWCAKIASSLTAKSHKEDRFGVAQLSNSNAAVISALLSCLVAVEAFLGKKQSSSNHSSSGIKWAALNPGRRDNNVTVSRKRGGGPFYLKAYALADTLRLSIYSIVSEFHTEMLTNAKTGLLEDWIISNKPPFGTRELLVQKLHIFLDYQA